MRYWVVESFAVSNADAVSRLFFKNEKQVIEIVENQEMKTISIVNAMYILGGNY